MIDPDCGPNCDPNCDANSVPNADPDFWKRCVDEMSAMEQSLNEELVRYEKIEREIAELRVRAHKDARAARIVMQVDKYLEEHQTEQQKMRACAESMKENLRQLMLMNIQDKKSRTPGQKSASPHADSENRRPKRRARSFA